MRRRNNSSFPTRHGLQYWTGGPDVNPEAILGAPSSGCEGGAFDFSSIR